MNDAETIREYLAREDKHSPFGAPTVSQARAALDALVAERDEARRERDGWQYVAGKDISVALARAEAAEARVTELEAEREAQADQIDYITSELNYKKKALRNCREAHLAAVAERDVWQNLAGNDIGAERARAEAAEAQVAKLRVSLSDALDQLHRGVPIGIEMAEKILRAALAKEDTDD